MIIDAHAHIGYDYVFDSEQDENKLMEANRQYGVGGAVVQPLICRPYLEDTRQAHDRVYALCLKYPGEIWGMASINPHFRPEDYDRELSRCVKELGFVGVKITPIGYAAHPGTKDCRHVYEIARSLHIPVMIHTGDGGTFADPVSILDAIADFPQVKFILAHGGTDIFVQQAVYLAKKFGNVYMEPSWLNVLSVKAAIDTLGTHRVMFSSDVAENIPVELAKYRSAVKDEKMLEQVLYRTAAEVFGLNFNI